MGFSSQVGHLDVKTHSDVYIWMFPKIVVPQNGWFIMENPIKIGGTIIFGNTHIYIHICRVCMSKGPN